MPRRNPRLRRKTWTFIALTVVGNVAGNTLIARGVRGEEVRVGAAAPWVIAGVALLACAMISQMLLLSWADLSYVLPLTATGYVLSAFAGSAFLNEQVSLARWAGVALISLGVVLVTPTPARTAPAEAAR